MKGFPDGFLLGLVRQTRRPPLREQSNASRPTKKKQSTFAASFFCGSPLLCGDLQRTNGYKTKKNGQLNVTIFPEGGISSNSHTIHGTGIFTYIYILDVYGKLYGHYASPMDAMMGFFDASLQNWKKNPPKEPIMPLWQHRNPRKKRKMTPRSDDNFLSLHLSL